ncbi:MAG: ribosomal protein large subunit ribosomal protein [Candidatus Kaiserbacteria bacterium]|nr:ribosomal protein large subunit ribosomal protein [Candidatus Kaiserbacteria bacterium]
METMTKELPKQKKHTIDASGRAIGRIASEAAKALMGKMHADYTPNIYSNVQVIVTNASKIYTRERKRTQKIYTTYSGHPGGQKRESLSNLNARKGYGEAVRRAVQRMLPNNTMRVRRMKSLIISE